MPPSDSLPFNCVNVLLKYLILDSFNFIINPSAMHNFLRLVQIPVPIIVITSNVHLFLTCSHNPFLEKLLVHSIESVVIDWCHQVRDVLKKCSARTLLDGDNPGSLVEIDFWKARWSDLESIVEQV